MKLHFVLGDPHTYCDSTGLQSVFAVKQWSRDLCQKNLLIYQLCCYWCDTKGCSSSNPIYKYELKKFKWNNVAWCCSCVLVLTCVHVCLWLWCTLVCVKLPLLAYLYFPCRDTDSPSDKPHLHLQSQLLRLSLFSLISKLPLIPSVLYLAALSLLRPSWKPDVKPACLHIHTPM